MSILALAILVPLFFCLLTGFLPAGGRFKVLACGMFVSLGLNAALLSLTTNARSVSLHFLSSRFGGLHFYADGFGVCMALLISLLGAALILCSSEFFNTILSKKGSFVLVNLFFASSIAAVYSGDLLTLFSCQEIAVFSFAGFAAVNFLPDTGKARAKLFLEAAAGTVLIAIALAGLGVSQKTFLLEALKGKIMVMPQALLIIVALFLRALVLSVQPALGKPARGSWAVACFLILVFLLGLCVSVLVRLFYFTFFTTQDFSNIALVLSALVLLAASCLALIEKNGRKFLVYAALAQFANLMLLLASANALSIELVILCAAVQSFGLAGIFLSMGAALDAAGSDRLDEKERFGKQMPFFAAAFLLCAFSVAGMPPLAGCWPKVLALLHALQEGRFLIEGIAVLGSLLSLFYYLRAHNLIFPAKKTSPAQTAGHFSFTKGAVVLFVSLLLLMSAGIKPVFNFFHLLLK